MVIRFSYTGNTRLLTIIKRVNTESGPTFSGTVSENLNFLTCDSEFQNLFL